jgi:hypothetical protein
MYFTLSYCKQLASNVKLATRKYKIISCQLSSFEVLFSHPAEVSVAMGEWATVNFCPCCQIPSAKKIVGQQVILKSNYFESNKFYICNSILKKIKIT